MRNISIQSNCNDKDILSNVDSLLMSETCIMETELQSRHQCMKTGDVLFLMEGCSDIAEKITESTDEFSEAISNFSKTVSRGMTGISSEFCDLAKKNNSIDKLDDFSFTIVGYKYKTLSTKRIDLSELDSVVNDYNKMITSLQNAVTSDAKLSEFEDKSRQYLEESNLSKVRAKMLGVHDAIYEDDFLNEVRNYYRGSSLCVDVTVDKKYVKKIPDEQKKLIKDRTLTMEEMSHAMNTFSIMTDYLVGTLNGLNDSGTGISCTISGISLKSKGQLSTTSKLLVVPKHDTDTISKCITILRLTYSKVVKLQSMAQIILSERLVALKDQMQQNMVILDTLKAHVKAGVQNTIPEKETPVLSKYTQESFTNVDTSSLQPILDYTELAMENLILSHPEHIKYLENRYLQESAFMLACFQNMRVDRECFVMEASETTLSDRLVEFLNKMIGVFRKKMIEYNDKYSADIKALYDKGTFLEKAKSYTEKKEILPYWKVTNIDQDKSLIKNALSKGATNKDLDNLSYMSSMVSVSNVAEWDKKKGQLRGYLLNYFRCHEKDAEQVKKITVSGPDIASKLKIMVDYITGYAKIVTGIEDLRNTAKTNMASLTNVQESLRFLELEQCPIEASDIALLEGFYALLEAENDDKKTGEAVGSDGEKASPTSVDSVGNDKDNNSNNDKQEESKPTSNRYANIYERFFELAITAYMTACEERYIAYINILRDLNGGAFSSKEEKNDKKEKAVTDSFVYTESYFNKPSEMKGTSLYK